MNPPPPEHRAYLEVLHHLLEGGVRFAVAGSLALRLYMDALGGEPVPDCDLFLDPAPDNLHAWAEVLAREGWALAVWGEPVVPPLDLERLRGRYYVRARKGALVMDGTYEHDTLSLEALVTSALYAQGLPLADLETLLKFKRERGNPRDLEALAQVERWRQETHPEAGHEGPPRRGRTGRR